MFALARPERTDPIFQILQRMGTQTKHVYTITSLYRISFVFSAQVQESALNLVRSRSKIETQYMAVRLGSSWKSIGKSTNI